MNESFRQRVDDSVDEESTNLVRRRSRRSQVPQGYVQSNSALRERFGTRKIGGGPAQFSDRDTTPSARAILPGSNPTGGFTDRSTWNKFAGKTIPFSGAVTGGAVSLAAPSQAAAPMAPAPITGAAGYLDRIIGGAESPASPGFRKTTRPLFGGGTMDEYETEDGGILRSLKTPYGTVDALTPGSIASRLRRNNLGYTPLT